MALFAGAPMLLALGIGFFRVDGFGGHDFVGLANYGRMLRDPLFLRSLRLTLVFVAVAVPGLYSASLGLALLVQRRGLQAGMARTLFFVPQTVSLVVVALVWQALLADKVGMVNWTLAMMGIAAPSWLGSPGLALFTIAFVSVWFSAGAYMLVFLGGLQAIPSEYYDAARLDGAGPVNAFIHITLPLLRPASFFVILVTTVVAVAGEQTFDLVYVMTKGGPANATALTIFYIYEVAFQNNEFGYASAMSCALVAILMTITLGLYALTRGGRFGGLT